MRYTGQFVQTEAVNQSRYVAFGIFESRFRFDGHACHLKHLLEFDVEEWHSGGGWGLLIAGGFFLTFVMSPQLGSLLELRYEPVSLLASFVDSLDVACQFARVDF